VSSPNFTQISRWEMAVFSSGHLGRLWLREPTVSREASHLSPLHFTWIGSELSELFARNHISGDHNICRSCRKLACAYNNPVKIHWLMHQVLQIKLMWSFQALHTKSDLLKCKLRYIYIYAGWVTAEQGFTSWVLIDILNDSNTLALPHRVV